MSQGSIDEVPWYTDFLPTVAQPPGSPNRSEGMRGCPPTLAAWTAVLGYDEWMAAGWRLTGPAGASHKAPKAGAQVAGFPGVWELLAAQIGYPQILTAYERRSQRGGQKGVRGKQSFPELDLGV